MSEYQYYEFQAVDRRLTDKEMVELRAISSRAAITPTRFQNTYSYGDFRGDPLELVKRSFDAFVYLANWGTNQLILRLPRRLLDPAIARRYAADSAVEVETTDQHVIVTFNSEEEEYVGWIEDEEAAGWMPKLLPLREALAAGDLRPLYIGWLSAARAEMLDDDAVEPPVPPGLGKRSSALEALVEFLRVDEDLLAVAAKQSPALPKPPSRAELEQFIRHLPASEKDDLLIRLVVEQETGLRAELLQRLRQEQDAAARGARGDRAESAENGSARSDATRGARRRIVADLLGATEKHATERRREEARREAAARAVYLDGLIARKDELWREVKSLIEAKRAAEYDRAVQLLVDLRDASAQTHQEGDFARRLHSLSDVYARRPALLDRMNRAGLPT